MSWQWVSRSRFVGRVILFFLVPSFPKVFFFPGIWNEGMRDLKFESKWKVIGAHVSQVEKWSVRSLINFLLSRVLHFWGNMERDVHSECMSWIFQVYFWICSRASIVHATCDVCCWIVLCLVVHSTCGCEGRSALVDSLSSPVCATFAKKKKHPCFQEQTMFDL